ncbi:hypothetical protein SMQE32_13090 [Serratia marcescens]|uniref:Bacteriophage protein n=1 Tax=Serratia marcescens TaxID=615 RepID=A0ABD5IPL7_SERMA|nr:hypothetical protein [Serratia marcescens]MDX7085621.1 hypothetical protein [Serratia marcescens]BEO70490.1 hypothetical protein SMQE32_13090 [Serratia marcescens]HCH6764227.1 hypothetical protein [Serratia marcescens]HEJ6971332.1 hypothetical protein [Serratia marcescens]HEJ6977894.1 hypothetical protein [Serratia marcescens]
MKQSLVKIRVHTPFTFTHLNYEVEKFAVGVHSVAPEVAENWFIQEYAEILDDGQPDNAGAPAEVLAQIADLQKQLAEEKSKVADLTTERDERDQLIAEHVATIGKCDDTIADLQKQLAAALTEGAKGGKK